MKNIRIRAIIFGLVAAAAGGLVVAIYFHWSGDPAPSSQLVLYGNVDIREVNLAFNATGRVDKMLVEEGSTVEAGQLLATLESDLYQAEVEAAEARIAAQRAVLNRLVAGSRPEEIELARANVSAIDADLDDARSNLQRTEKLAIEQFAPMQKLDEARARVKSLQAQLKASQQALVLAIQGPRTEEIAEARAQLQVGEAELALVRRRLGYTELKAKESGIINTRIVEPGAVVLANAPVYTLALTSPVWVRTYVSEPDLGNIRSGMGAEIVTDSAPDKVYEGWVGFISPVAEFTPKSVETAELRTSLVYRLRVYVTNSDHGLRQGMPVTVRLKTDAEPGNGSGPARQ